MREIVYIGNDNTIDLQFLADGKAIDGSVITRTVLDIGGTVVDSSAVPAVFDWSAGNGVLKMSLGNESLTAGEFEGTFTLYDAGNPAGIRWEDDDGLIIEVVT